MPKNVSKLNLKQHFQHAGYRYTTQRQAVLDAILENKDIHLNSEEIYSLLKEKHPEMGMATVYRTLSLLEKLQLIRRVDLDDSCARYEIYDQEGHDHHHLICSQCGVIMDMQDDLLEALEKQIFEKYNFLVENHSVKFYGRCVNCLR